MEFHTAGVIGGGAWGTALAQSAAAAGLAVVLQARESEVVESIRTRRVNEAFLPGIELDSAINVTSDLADLADCDLILAVPPAQHMRATLSAFAPYARPGLPIILCSKGIERGSLKLMTDVLAETIPSATAWRRRAIWRLRTTFLHPRSAATFPAVLRRVSFPSSTLGPPEPSRSERFGARHPSG